MPVTPLRVLVVEDDTIEYKDLCADLDELGFVTLPQVTSLVDYKAIKQPFDLAIVDMELRGKTDNRDGVRIIQHLRGKRPVIIHTIHGEEKVRAMISPQHNVWIAMKPAHLATWRMYVTQAVLDFYGPAARKRFGIDMPPQTAHQLFGNRFHSFAVPNQGGPGTKILPHKTISYIETRPKEAKGKLFFIADSGTYSRIGTLQEIIDNKQLFAGLIQINRGCLVRMNCILTFTASTVTVEVNPKVYGKASVVLPIGKNFRDGMDGLKDKLG